MFSKIKDLWGVFVTPLIVSLILSGLTYYEIKQTLEINYLSSFSAEIIFLLLFYLFYYFFKKNNDKNTEKIFEKEIEEIDKEIDFFNQQLAIANSGHKADNQVSNLLINNKLNELYEERCEVQRRKKAYLKSKEDHLFKNGAAAHDMIQQAKSVAADTISQVTSKIKDNTKNAE